MLPDQAKEEIKRKLDEYTSDPKKLLDFYPFLEM
jgi:hypothetical protein